MAYQRRNPGTRAFEEYAAKVLEIFRSPVERTLHQMAGDNGADVIMYGQDGTITYLQAKWAQPTAADMRAAEDFLETVLPRAADHPDEVEAAAAEVTSDPERRKEVAWVAGLMKRPEVQKLSQWTLVIVAIVLLMHVMGLLPVEQLSAAQDSLDNRALGVLGVAVGLAAIVMSSRD
jgi:hypothetical protein